MKKYQAVVFDLDDTLYLERDFVFSGFGAVSVWAEKNLGFSSAASMVELGTLFAQGARGNIFDQWLAAHGSNLLQFIPKLVEIYREHEPSIAPLPEVPELLPLLKSQYRLGLLSDGYVAVQKRKLTALKLARWFDVIVFSDEWGKEAWKPSSFCFESVIHEMKITGSQAVYVADNPLKDFSGAKKVGLTTIRVRHPLGLYAEREAASPEDASHFEIRNLNELERILIK